MPFTISHAAAVLPLRRLDQRLPLTALMVGSMAPDFGYFVAHDISRAFTHSVAGLVTFSLPAGFAVWLFYVVVLEKATITLLSDRWHTRFAHTEKITLSLLVRACVAIVLGAATHLAWDSFTHRGTPVMVALPVLSGPTPGVPWLPVYHLLHGLSSVVGLAILARWARHLHRQPARSLIRPYHVSARLRAAALWFLSAATLLVAAVEWWPYSHSRYDTQLFSLAVGGLSGFFVGLSCVAVAFWMWGRRFRAG